MKMILFMGLVIVVLSDDRLNIYENIMLSVGCQVDLMVGN